ncbi:uncharacterized protein LOC133313170 [Gastrolobium bilobum]|uniref:uncharacterized protein LOC133313170 n=1 Tax=Gastrolobium bilobum TaxID=150636 RepID=UPI002AB0E926|nr:uncharacterized protein LOC133313170 [Gastrolobium bilobum]
MKRFYRQRKKIIKKTPKSKKKSRIAAERHDDDYSAEEKILRQFDMNMIYGPCVGLTRLARWERAHEMGLNPPYQVENLLKSVTVKVKSECLWYKRK